MPRKLFNVLLGVITVIAVVGAFTSFERKRNAFENLDFAYHWDQGLIRVEAVDPGSNAARAGLKPGDTVLAVGNTPASELDGFKRTLRATGPVMLIVTRGSETFAVRYSAPPMRVDYHYLFLTFIGFLYLAIGLFTLFRGERDESLLFYFVTLLAFIVYAYSPAGEVDSTFKSLWLVEEFARILLPPLTLHFFLKFPRPLFRTRRALAALYAAPAILGLWVADLLLFNNAVAVAAPERSFAIIDRWEMLHFAVYFTLAFVTLTYTYRTAAAVGHRKQIQWIYLGMAVGFIPFLILYLIPFIRTGAGTAYTNLAILPLAFIPLAFAVSILKYKLWDVEVVIKEILAYTVTFIFGMIAFSTVNVLLSSLIAERKAMERNFLAFASGLVIAGVLVPVKGRIESLVEMFLYRETYRHRKAMLEMAQEIATFHDLNDLFDTMRDRLSAAIQLAKMNLYLRDGASLVLYTQENGVPDRVVENDFGVMRERPILLDQPRLPVASPLPAVLLRSGYRVVFPLRHRGELQGLLLCGNKRGDEPLSRDDMQLIGTLTAPLSLAIENARLYGRLRRQLEEIRTLKEYNENIIESSLSAIVVVAADGTLLTANHAFWELTGLSPETDRTIHQIFPALANHGLNSAVSELDYVNERGEEKHLTITASPFNAPDAPSDAIVLVIADVSDRVRLQRELQEKERLAALGLLAAGVAHEVNTPLTGISSYAQMLIADTSPEDPRYSILKKMEQQTFRASHLVNNLLNFAAKRAHTIELVRLADVVRASVAAHEDLLRQKQIAVHLDLDESVTVSGSAFELQQVVTNLLLNAKDAVEPRGKVSIRVTRDRGEALLAVRDDGSGIPPEIVSRIFEPLFTTKRSSGGTGLGLAICHKIVENHRGRITVSSEPGAGATFFISLPLQDPKSH